MPYAGVERRHGELVLEVVGEREVDGGVDAVLALRGGHLGDRHAFPLLERR
jgi:hypothetical protein